MNTQYIISLNMLIALSGAPCRCALEIVPLNTELINAQCTAAPTEQDEKNRELLTAAKAGDTATVRTLLTQNAYLDSIYDWPKIANNALDFAAHAGHTEIVKLLLRNNACPNAHYYFQPVLHTATAQGHADTVLALLIAKAHVDITGWDGQTALHVATSWGHDKIIPILLGNAASIEAINMHSETALCIATRNLNTTAVNILVAAHYNTLIKRYPAIKNMENNNLQCHMLGNLPNELWEIIVKNYSPHEIANFRFVCKYFRELISKPFDNVRKLRTPQLKKTLITHISQALRIAENIDTLHDQSLKDSKQIIIDLLKTELEQANGLDVDELLNGVIICKGRPHLDTIQMDIIPISPPFSAQPNQPNDMLEPSTYGQTKNIKKCCCNLS